MAYVDVSKQKRNLPLLASRETCSGRTYIVTGANVGLGFEAAKHLASLGAAKVVLAVRNTGAGETAKAAIEAETGVAAGVVEVWPFDKSSYGSVRAFAARAAAELERIDGLIENAAVAPAEHATAEGHTLAVTVNLLSPLLLAALLLPEMKRKAGRFGIQPRFVIVTSRVGFTVREHWEKLKGDPIAAMDDQEKVPTLYTYPLSKLTLTMAVKHFFGSVLPLDRAGVIVNLVCPGLCVTSLGRHVGPEHRNQLREQHEKYGRTAEDGSRTLLHGVVAGGETHGLLLHSCEIGEADVPTWAQDDKEAQKRAWEVVAAELEAAVPGCVDKMLQGQ